MTKPAGRRRLLTIGHSYCVELNRRLAGEIARHGDWDVTVVGPARFHGESGWHALRPEPLERCRVIPVPVHFSRRVQVMLYGRRLRELLREPWDLVHCWEEPYVAAAAQVAFRASRDVPLVFATFQNISKRYPPPFNWIEHYTLSRADGIVAFGQTVRDVLAARVLHDVPIQVISPGVDVDHFSPSAAQRHTLLASYGWRDSPPVVGFVGRLVPEKGCLRLAAALDRLAVPWRAIFVGSGPLEAELRRWSLGHGDRVRVETTVSHEQVAGYMNGMDLLCAPSQTTAGWREQFGRMLIEAFACGVPVVASDSGEIPYVVGDAGVVVGERDDDGWVRAISELLRDPAKRADLARRGRQRAMASFSWPGVARQHVDFFDQVIAARRRALRDAPAAATLAVSRTRLGADSLDRPRS